MTTRLLAAVVGATLFSLAPALIQAEPLEQALVNPFATPGDQGVGEGWRVRSRSLVNVLAHLEDDSLRLDAPAPGEPRVFACQVDLTPVSSRVLVQGEIRTEGIDVSAKWKGGRVMLRYYDRNGDVLPVDVGSEKSSR